MSFARRRLLRALAGTGSFALLCAALDGRSLGALAMGLLYLLPAIALAFFLFLGRYPGERTLQRLQRALASPRSRPASSPLPRVHPVELLRGGRLIAVSLAGRGPPRAAVCC